MPIKYIGAMMVFLSCGVAGFKVAANYREEQRCLLEFSRHLDHMESELEYRLTPMPQLFSGLAADATGCIQAVFLKLSQELEGQTSPDAPSCMETALLAVNNIPPQLRRFLSALGNSLGRYDLQGQMNEIAAIKQQCNTQLEQMQHQQDARLRGYRTLGLCIGAALAILLI